MSVVPAILVAITVIVALAFGRFGFWKPVKGFLRFASGEFLLDKRPNGGDVILVRTLLTSAVIYVIAIGVNERLVLGSTWGLSMSALRRALHESLPWLGAIFAGVYAVFYTRFSSQWIYLAGVYNQLMAMQVRHPNDGTEPERSRTYAAWWAGFIEDAEEVHLAMKPVYASVIAGLLGDPSVRRAYELSTVGGSERLNRLVEQLRERLGSRIYEELVARGNDRAADRGAVTGEHRIASSVPPVDLQR